MKANYFQDKLNWLTSEACPEHEKAFIRCKIRGKEWGEQPCCSIFEVFDRRTLGKTKNSILAHFNVVFILIAVNELAFDQMHKMIKEKVEAKGLFQPFRASGTPWDLFKIRGILGPESWFLSLKSSAF